jgi:hypothetical protein
VIAERGVLEQGLFACHQRPYRWLALQYARQRGRIHPGLIETLFRYNSRARMGSLLHRLQEFSRQTDRA